MACIQYKDFLHMRFNILYSILMWYPKPGCFGSNPVGLSLWEILKNKITRRRKILRFRIKENTENFFVKYLIRKLEPLWFYNWVIDFWKNVDNILSVNCHSNQSDINNPLKLGFGTWCIFSYIIKNKFYKMHLRNINNNLITT